MDSAGIKKYDYTKLAKYNIHFKPEGIGLIVECADKYLRREGISFMDPSMGYHVTVLGFYSDAGDECISQTAKSLPPHPKQVAADRFEVLDDALALLLKKDKELEEYHNSMLETFMPYISFKDGSGRVINNQEKFSRKYMYTGKNYNPHMTLALGSFFEIAADAKHNMDNMLRSNPEKYDVNLYVYKKEDTWRNI